MIKNTLGPFSLNKINVRFPENCYHLSLPQEFYFMDLFNVTTLNMHSSLFFKSIVTNYCEFGSTCWHQTKILELILFFTNFWWDFCPEAAVNSRHNPEHLQTIWIFINVMWYIIDLSDDWWYSLMNKRMEPCSGAMLSAVGVFPGCILTLHL